ncbi:MAG: hypothetical protein V9G15_06350 [Dermatophilaceae bacterium]|nr:hypothetical protein [Actinomycetales bacterium]
MPSVVADGSMPRPTIRTPSLALGRAPAKPSTAAAYSRRLRSRLPIRSPRHTCWV